MFVLHRHILGPYGAPLARFGGRFHRDFTVGLSRRCMSSDAFTVRPGEFSLAVRWLQASKGVPSRRSAWTRVVPELLLHDALRGTVAANDDFDGIIERAVRVYRAHKASDDGRACEKEKSKLPTGEHTFSRAEFSGYDHPTRSVLCMVDSHRTLVQRQQLSGLCYMHAPALVQYYARWHTLLQGERTGSQDRTGKVAATHGMLDLAWFIAERFHPAELEKHIFEDGGQNSVAFLRRILLPRSKLLYVSEPERAMEELRAYGPALVSGFRVFPDFQQIDVHKHYEPPKDIDSPEDSEADVSHAMVLVGAREDAAGRRFFLLQNWWAGKQFVEVSDEYLEATEAQLWFVQTPQPAAAAGLHTHAPHVRYAETAAALEHAERKPLERGAR